MDHEAMRKVSGSRHLPYQQALADKEVVGQHTKNLSRSLRHTYTHVHYTLYFHYFFFHRSAHTHIYTHISHTHLHNIFTL